MEKICFSTMSSEWLDFYESFVHVYALVLYKIKVMEIIIFYFSLIFNKSQGQQIILECCLHRFTYECQ